MESNPPTAQDPTPAAGSKNGGDVFVANEAALERFARAFETSARRWELVVYPALFAFIILAGYGFFLIFSLTQDMHVLAKSVDPRMSVHLEGMHHNMVKLSENIGHMTERMNEMSLNMETIAMDTEAMNLNLTNVHKDMSAISGKMDALDPMLTNIASMSRSINNMTTNTAYMTRDMEAMSSNVARPMSFMNSFFPMW